MTDGLGERHRMDKTGPRSKAVAQRGERVMCIMTLAIVVPFRGKGLAEELVD